MLVNISPDLARRAVEEDMRLMFHGTCQEFTDFSEGSVGLGGDDNSALGVHLAELPHHAAEYAEAGASRSEGEPRVLLVLVPAKNPYTETNYDRFFGYDDEGQPHPDMGKAGFSRWRQELQAQGHDVVDYEDGEGPITVALDLSDLKIVGQLSVQEAYDLADRLDQVDDAFDTATRLRLLAPPTPSSSPRSRRP